MNICYAYSSNRRARRRKKILNKLCEKKQKPKKVKKYGKKFPRLYEVNTVVGLPIY